MDASSFISGILQNLIANWIQYLLGLLMATIIAIWGKFWEAWSWPTIIIASLIAFATILFIYDHWPKTNHKETEVSYNWKTAKKEPVIGKTFRNERVVLDGKSFSGCKFYNVTFEYNGTAPFDLVNNEIYGSRMISSKNPAILGLIRILKELKYIDPKIEIFDE